MPKVVKKKWVKRPITEADVPALVAAVRDKHASSLYGTMTEDAVVKPKVSTPKGKVSTPYGKKRAEENSDDDEEEVDDRLADKLAAIAQDIDSDDDEEFPALGSGKTVATMADDILNDDEEEYDPDAENLGMTSGGNDVPEGGYKTFADYVFEAIEENKRKEAEDQKMALFTPLTIQTYTQVRQFLSHYKSGKLPKALKIIPSLKNWMDVLWLTHPEQWTPHAIEAVTSIFVKNLKDNQVQKYLQFVVLPQVLKSIDEDKRLNIHLYKALQAALFKPTPWFKGIFFPTVLDDQCTYQRAVILCSVLSKHSFPATNCGAAIVILSHHKPYTNVIAYCLIKLINKKHNLPLSVVTELVHFFRGFLNTEETQPVVWHQALLTFIQRWKGSLTMEQVEVIREILRAHPHAQISAEIRRELASI